MRSWAGTVQALVLPGSGTGRAGSCAGRAGSGAGRDGRGSGVGRAGSGWVGLAGARSGISFVMHPASFS